MMHPFFLQRSERHEAALGVKETVGDRHNFGQATELRDGWFHKPRCVAWERLCFGVDSPLLDLEGFSRETFFALDVAFSPGWCEGFGKVRAHVPSEVDPDRAWRGFGALSAFAQLFGLRDLHVANVVFRPGSWVQPVDVEMVAYCRTNREALLSYSGLLPAFAPLPSPLDLLPVASDVDAHTACLSGYTTFTRSALGCLGPMRSLLSTLTARWPIRVLVRPTSAYWFWLAERGLVPGVPPLPAGARALFPDRDALERLEQEIAARNPLALAEKAQLERGEVPFFWTYWNEADDLGRPAYWMTDPSGTEERVEGHGIKIGYPVSLDAMLDPERVEFRAGIGLAELAYTLAQRSFAFEDMPWSARVDLEDGGRTEVTTPSVRWVGEPRAPDVHDWRAPLDLFSE